MYTGFNLNVRPHCGLTPSAIDFLQYKDLGKTHLAT